MASSVVSGKQMEAWQREREFVAARAVQTTKEKRENFNAMKPDFKALEDHEGKVQRLAERQEAKEHELEVVPIINVMGSTAGAGSGEFHTFRGFRAKEYARLADMERERKAEKEQKEWEEERAAEQTEQDTKTSKKAEKRKRKKEAKKAAAAASKVAKVAGAADDAAAPRPSVPVADDSDS
jgi:hypothetical protein